LSKLKRYTKHTPLLSLVLRINVPLYQESDSLSLTAKMKYLTCDIPKRQIHVRRSATGDADTVRLTEAGWIPLIQMYTTRTAVAMICFHFVQSTIRIAKYHATFVNMWYLSTGLFNHSMNSLTSHR
jgi:hypothetical protein